MAPLPEVRGRFVAASILGTVYSNNVAAADNTATQAVATNFRTRFLILGFVSITPGIPGPGAARGRLAPDRVVASATVVNIVLALALASVLFAKFTIRPLP